MNLFLNFEKEKFIRNANIKDILSKKLNFFWFLIIILNYFKIKQKLTWQNTGGGGGIMHSLIIKKLLKFILRGGKHENHGIKWNGTNGNKW